MNLLDEQIAQLKTNLASVKRQRQEASETFMDEQASIFDRQVYASQQLEKLHQKGSMARHVHAIQDQSCFDDSPYIIAKEATLCRALHMVEVKTNELRILIQHHNNIVDHMEEERDKQERLREEQNSLLQTNIKFASIDMAGIVVENQESLKRQRCEIYELGGVGEMESLLDDLPYDDSFTGASSSSSSSSSSSYLVESLSSLFKPRRQNRRRSMEKRITKVSSYFGVYQTAQAA